MIKATKRYVSISILTLCNQDIRKGMQKKFRVLNLKLMYEICDCDITSPKDGVYIYPCLCLEK